jgi:hypothetical protein
MKLDAQHRLTLSPSMDSKESQTGVIRAYKKNKHTRTEQLTPSLLDSQNSVSLESSGRARMNNFSSRRVRIENFAFRSLHDKKFMKLDAQRQNTLSPSIENKESIYRKQTHQYRTTDASFMIRFTKQRQLRLQLKNES